MPGRIKVFVFLCACVGAFFVGLIGGSFGDLGAVVFLEIAYIVGVLPGTLVALSWKSGYDDGRRPAPKHDTDSSE